MARVGAETTHGLRRFGWRRFSVPAFDSIVIARSLGQGWPQALRNATGSGLYAGAHGDNVIKAWVRPSSAE